MGCSSCASAVACRSSLGGLCPVRTDVFFRRERALALPGAAQRRTSFTPGDAFEQRKRPASRRGGLPDVPRDGSAVGGEPCRPPTQDIGSGSRDSPDRTCRELVGVDIGTPEGQCGAVEGGPLQDAMSKRRSAARIASALIWCPFRGEEPEEKLHRGGRSGDHSVARWLPSALQSVTR